MKSLAYFVYFLATPLIGAPKEVQNAFYDNGTVKQSFEATVRSDGKPGGIMKDFYPDGILKLEMPIMNAGGELGYAPDGVVKSYYPNGKLESLVEWTGEKRNGPFELFYQDGSVRERGVFKNDRSTISERFTRSKRKLSPEPCLVIEVGTSRVIPSQDVVLHVDSYHDTGAHIGWVFGYRLVGKEWQRDFQQSRGDHIGSRETKTISVPVKELAPGEWQFAVTSTVRGPDFFTEARSTTIRIEQAAAGDGDRPAK
jgi:MORN repeat variant